MMTPCEPRPVGRRDVDRVVKIASNRNDVYPGAVVSVMVLWVKHGVFMAGILSGHESFSRSVANGYEPAMLFVSKWDVIATEDAP